MDQEDKEGKHGKVEAAAMIEGIEYLCKKKQPNKGIVFPLVRFYIYTLQMTLPSPLLSPLVLWRCLPLWTAGALSRLLTWWHLFRGPIASPQNRASSHRSTMMTKKRYLIEGRYFTRKTEEEDN